jgi:hypothetical protein
MLALPPIYVGTRLPVGSKHASRGAHARTTSGSGALRKTHNREDVRATIVITGVHHPAWLIPASQWWLSRRP